MKRILYLKSSILRKIRQLLFTNSETLYSFLVPDVCKADLRYFDRLFFEHLAKYLRTEAFVTRLPKSMENASSSVTIAATNSKVVLGSMNDLAFQFETYIQAEGGLSNCNIREIHQKVNQTPMSAIGYSHPWLSLKERLDSIST